MRSLKLYVSIAVPFIISIIWGIYLSKANNPHLYTATVYLLVLIHSILYFMEFRVIWPFYVKYMFNTKAKKIIPGKEKPRLFFYLTLGLLNLILLYNFQRLHQENSNIILNILFLSFNLVSAGFLFYTWTPSFNDVVVRRIKKKLSINDLGIGLSKNEIISIYQSLNDSNLITIINKENEHDEENIFYEMFSNSQENQAPLFALRMSNSAIHYFYERLKEHWESFTLKDLSKYFVIAKKSDEFRLINVNSISSSASKTPIKEDVKIEIDLAFNINIRESE